MNPSTPTPKQVPSDMIIFSKGVSQTCIATREVTPNQAGNEEGEKPEAKSPFWTGILRKAVGATGVSLWLFLSRGFGTTRRIPRAGRRQGTPEYPGPLSFLLCPDRPSPGKFTSVISSHTRESSLQPPLVHSGSNLTIRTRSTGAQHHGGRWASPCTVAVRSITLGEVYQPNESQ
ncbi:hypothetical protein PG993_000260 [Apiospora rasikravindrae]|uniref:Uncharacterized protein n=1 Tax=Apiospora rasikravindrae TaxID=990691 RepID=A0ABR1U803_9PEZI